MQGNMKLDRFSNSKRLIKNILERLPAEIAVNFEIAV